MLDLPTAIMQRDGASFAGPVNVGVITCAAVTTFFAAVFVSLRFYTRCFIVNKVVLEDWLVLVSFLLAIGLAAGNCIRT